MASAVYTESQTHPERRPLSLCFDVPASSSPFPSPSSSFLPPPTPGAHEFAVKPPPPGRNSRKQSFMNDTETISPVQAALTSPKSPTRSYTLNSNSSNGQQNGDPSLALVNSSLEESNMLSSSSSLPSPQATTPTPAAVSSLPPSTSTYTSVSTPTPTSDTFDRPKTPPSSQHPYPTSIDTMTTTPAPTPNRPAPPSPDVSRRISSISTTSARSRSSRPPSAPISRNNSTRKPSTPATIAAAVAARLSQQHNSPSPMSSLSAAITPSKASTTASTSYSSPLPSPHTFTFTTNASSTSTTNPAAAAPTVVSTIPRTLMHVRDFAFGPTDDRFRGLGPDVPKDNKVTRLVRRLRGTSMDSFGGSSDDDDDDNEGDGEDGEEDGVDAAWDRLRRGGWGMRVIHSGTTTGGGGGSAGSENGPSQNEINWNFENGAEAEYEEEYEDDGEGDEEEEEEPLYPGLYRALYAFQPEGTAEMALSEDQIVRVVGRGGGVGWAVVVVDEAEGSDGPEKHALVPESYLEPVRLDWEDEEADADADAEREKKGLVG